MSRLAFRPNTTAQVVSVTTSSARTAIQSVAYGQHLAVSNPGNSPVYLKTSLTDAGTASATDFDFVVLPGTTRIIAAVKAETDGGPLKPCGWLVHIGGASVSLIVERGEGF